MYTCPIQLTDVRYNPAAQQFEANVTVHDDNLRRTYACAICAPITTAFEDAAKQLSQQALHHHVTSGGLLTHIAVQPVTQPRVHRRFDPVRWLNRVVTPQGRRLA